MQSDGTIVRLTDEQAEADPGAVPITTSEAIILQAWAPAERSAVLSDLRTSRQTRRRVEREFAKRIARRTQP